MTHVLRVWRVRRKVTGLVMAGLLASMSSFLLVPSRAVALPPTCTGEDCPPPHDPPPRAGTFDSAKRVPAGVQVDGHINDVLPGVVKVQVKVNDRIAGEVPASNGQDFSGVVPVIANDVVSVSAIAVTARNAARSLTWAHRVAIFVNPFGELEGATPGPRGIHVWGLALDMDTWAPGAVRVTLDGGTAATTVASLDRPDAGDIFGYGTAHGFDVTIPAPKGNHRVCVVGVNVGPGADTELGCRDVKQGGPPTRPFFSGSETTSTSIKLIVNQPPGDADQVSVQRQRAGSKTWTTIASHTRPSTDKPIRGFTAVSKASPGHRYCFRIVAANSYGSSTSSAECHTAPLPALPAPTDIKADKTSTDSITWTWTDHASDEDHYSVKLDNGRTVFVNAKLGLNGTVSYVQTGLRPSTKVCIQVAAIKSGHGSSPVGWCIGDPSVWWLEGWFFSVL